MGFVFWGYEVIRELMNRHGIKLKQVVFFSEESRGDQYRIKTHTINFFII